MSWGRAWRAGLAIAGWLATTCAAVAQPLAVADVQRLLQEAPRRTLRFEETRESPWLAAPVLSSGRMTSSPGRLEKIVEQPRRETLRILPDRLETIVAGAAEPKTLLFAQAPAAAVLAGALRHVAAGELHALDDDFELVASGSARLWTVLLTPRHAQTGRFLKQIELQGAGSQLRVIVILESQGERTTTRLSPEP